MTEELRAEITAIGPEDASALLDMNTRNRKIEDTSASRTPWSRSIDARWRRVGGTTPQ